MSRSTVRHPAGGPLNAHEFVVADLANQVTARVVGKVRRQLQRMTEGRQSGDASPLKDLWEEICVQVQGEESVLWDSYRDLVQDFTARELRNLRTFELEAVWLQTDAGWDWFHEDGNDDRRAACEADEVAADLVDRLLEVAANWSNARIRMYLDGHDDEV